MQNNQQDVPFASVCGEVISSSLSAWNCISASPDTAPPFGSLLVASTASYHIFGIVSDIATSSIDTYHVPAFLGKTVAERTRSYPQSFAFLQTTFTSLTIGFQEASKKYDRWAPIPLPIHTLIYYASVDHYDMLFQDEQYAQMLLQQGLAAPHLEELLLAILHQRLMRRLLTSLEKEKFIETCLLMAGNEYTALKKVLHRAEQIFQNAISSQQTTVY